MASFQWFAARSTRTPGTAWTPWEEPPAPQNQSIRVSSSSWRYIRRRPFGGGCCRGCRRIWRTCTRPAAGSGPRRRCRAASRPGARSGSPGPGPRRAGPGSAWRARVRRRRGIAGSPGGRPAPAWPRCLRSRASSGGRHIDEGGVVELGGDGHGPDLAAAVLVDDQVGFAGSRALTLVGVVAVEEDDDVGVLLDGPGLAQVGLDGPLVLPLLGAAVELRKDDHGDAELAG